MYLLIIICSLLFLSGICEGMVEALRFRYQSVKRLLNTSDRFWNPAISWKNKYKNGDPAQGAKFLFSTNALVWLTDGYHLMNFVSNCLLFAAFASACTLGLGLIYVPIVFIAAHAAYSAGCSFVIDLVFRS